MGLLKKVNDYLSGRGPLDVAYIAKYDANGRRKPLEQIPAANISAYYGGGSPLTPDLQAINQNVSAHEMTFNEEPRTPPSTSSALCLACNSMVVMAVLCSLF